VTLIATGRSSQRRTETRTPPLSVVQPQAQQLRTGTDNLPILNQPVQAPGNAATDDTNMNTPSVWHQATQPGVSLKAPVRLLPGHRSSPTARRLQSP
jgi:cell division protein FtsZ